MQIEIDDEIFEYLQQQAVPFEDTPNSVLRRLLFGGKKKAHGVESGLKAIGKDTRKVDGKGSNEFIQMILLSDFGKSFRRQKPYRMMYMDGEEVVYFQNYNKESDKLWYRITAKPWAELSSVPAKSTICLTNPAERVAYIIPVADIIAQIENSGWDRDYLEINIDHMRARWFELNWTISDYLKRW